MQECALLSLLLKVELASNFVKQYLLCAHGRCLCYDVCKYISFSFTSIQLLKVLFAAFWTHFILENIKAKKFDPLLNVFAKIGSSTEIWIMSVITLKVFNTPDFGLGVSALIIFIQELKLEWCIFPPHGDMIISFYTLIT